jgi:sortase A
MLIATGLLLFGFVAYQLWGTGIQQARSQDRLQDEFSAQLAAAGTGAAPTTAPASTAPTSTVAAATPTAAPTVTSATAAPATTGTAASAPVAARPAPEPGEPVARIVIASIDVDQVVVSGVDTKSLEKAPGHYPDTPMPGEVGNASIAGHRSTFGAPFERVDELGTGDTIEVTTAAGRFVYRVTDSRVVEPTEVDVIANTPDAVLTLTSCWPKYSAEKRIIVRAALDPAAGAAATAPVPTMPPTTTTPATSPATAPGTGPATSAATPPTTLAAPASIDAFSLGWWSDDRAWGDVMLWGSLLALVTLAAWRLSRATRRNWAGGAAGLVPFVVALYFFYENVARLLPPSV